MDLVSAGLSCGFCLRMRLTPSGERPVFSASWRASLDTDGSYLWPPRTDLPVSSAAVEEGPGQSSGRLTSTSLQPLLSR